MSQRAKINKSLLLLSIPIFLGALLAGLLSQEEYVAPDLEEVNLSPAQDLVQEEVQEAAPKPQQTPALINKPIAKPILYDVPFTAQAPFGDWADPRQQNACEEASALIAVAWARGLNFDLNQALSEIIDIVEYQEDVYGEYRDTSAADTFSRIFQGYFNFDNVRLEEGIGAAEIKRELGRGNLVVVPANGQKLGNPFFTSPGPLEHMLVVIGYDPETEEFITNDPGTRHGEGFRYDEKVLEGALRDYPTGYHLPITEVNKVMIVVEPAV